ncbi:MAG: CaiB/BaiF CoA transferase family protein, partial [Gammaproteobacteria bacterium]
LLDTQVGWLANQALNYFISGRTPVRTGAWHPNLAPYQPFETGDDPIVIAVGNDAQFQRLCVCIERQDLTDDARFRTNPDRVQNRPALIRELEPEIRRHAAAHWLEALPRTGVPCCPINSIAQAFEDPQIRHRGMQITLEHPLSGRVDGVANPLNLSATPVEYEKAPPLLGEDTDEVLRRVLGYADDAIQGLRDNGVLGQS